MYDDFDRCVRSTGNVDVGESVEMFEDTYWLARKRPPKERNGNALTIKKKRKEEKKKEESKEALRIEPDAKPHFCLMGVTNTRGRALSCTRENDNTRTI